MWRNGSSTAKMKRMAGRRRKSRPLPSPKPAWENRVRYMSALIVEPEIRENSEISPDTADSIGEDYRIFCGNAGLIPIRDGWGLLHLTVRDKRGRRARATLATSDLTYHRIFVEAATHENRNTQLQLATVRYPYMRTGWPGPHGQGGSWTYGQPAPWSPLYRDAVPDIDEDVHAHGVQIATTGLIREACICLTESSSDALWTILDTTPLEEFSKILAPDGDMEFYVPQSCGIMPGWPVESLSSPCRCSEN